MKSNLTLTPPKVARRYGCTPEKVLAWIRAGELRAINIATKRGGRPRYVIDVADLAAFENMRAVVASPPSSRRRSAAPAGVTQYF
jgi:hypothetical protein